MMMEAEKFKRQIPVEPHWGFAYSMLQKVSGSFAHLIQQLDLELRNAVCVFYLVLRALDTVEDDTSIPVDIKMPILVGFHEHISDRDWHFSCGTNSYKVLMDKFHFVSIAFLELGKSYQETIKDITMRMGAGMAKFLCKEEMMERRNLPYFYTRRAAQQEVNPDVEVETVDDYDEYCHYVAGLVGLGLSKLFYAGRLEDEFPESLSNSMGLFLQKANIIKDYLEDINEMPKSRMFWPRQIWSKYAHKLEDLKYEENSVNAVQCLNDMVTNALVHAEDCLKYLSTLKSYPNFRFCAIPQIMAIGTLALCYGNVEVFRGVVKMRRGLTARISDHTRSMSDVYGAFYEFSSLLERKIDEKDPNASLTLKRVDSIKKACISSGLLKKRRLYVEGKRPMYNSLFIMLIVLVLAIFFALHLIK